MRQMMNHAVFGAVQTLNLFIGALELFVDAGIFNRQRHQIADCRQHLNIGLIKAALLFIDRTQHADHPPFDFQRHIRQVPCVIFDLPIDIANEMRIPVSILHNLGFAGPVDQPGNTSVRRVAHFFKTGTGLAFVKDRLAEKKLLVFFIQQNNHGAFDAQQILDFLGDQRQALIQAPILVHGPGNSEKRPVDARVALLPGHIAQGDNLPGRLPLLIVKDGAVDNDV